MIVVDIGCYAHPAHQGASQDSAERLVDRFRPRLYFGFDPHPSQGEGVDSVGPNGDTTRVFRRLAAWTFDGLVEFRPMRDSPLSAHVATEPDSIPVPCFDLASWMQALPFENEDVVLKLDCEGAEYLLVPRLIDLGLDEFLTLLLVEWHDLPARAGERDRLLASLRCPVESWT